MKGFSEEWNEIYGNNLQLTSWPWSDLISLVYRYCDSVISRKGAVFELGCGSGPNIPFIRSLGMSYYGVEGSRAVVEGIHQKFPELKEKVTTGDFTSIDQFKSLPNIDIIIDRAAVTHNDLSSIKRTLEYGYNALNSGGYFIGVDWFSTKHDDFKMGVSGGDKYTRTNIRSGQFTGVGGVHFSDEKDLRNIFVNFDIISLEEKVIINYATKNKHQFSSWNIVARKK